MRRAHNFKVSSRQVKLAKGWDDNAVGFKIRKATQTANHLSSWLDVGTTVEFISWSLDSHQNRTLADYNRNGQMWIAALFARE